MERVSEAAIRRRHPTSGLVMARNKGSVGGLDALILRLLLIVDGGPDAILQPNSGSLQDSISPFGAFINNLIGRWPSSQSYPKSISRRVISGRNRASLNHREVQKENLGLRPTTLGKAN